MKEGDYLMSNQEIIGGLRAAIGRGESLKDAMMTFYQAGYSKYDIEESARAYMNQQHTEPQMNASQRISTPIKEVKKIEEKKAPIDKKVLPPIKPIVVSPVIPQPGVPAAPKISNPKQKVSAYGTKPESKIAGKTLTIALTLILLLLLGVLVVVFVYGAEIIEFFNGLFA